MNRCARYEAFIPPEPKGLEAVRAESGTIYQRKGGQWMGAGTFGFFTWKNMLLSVGPVYPLVWSTDESEEGGAADAGQPDHSLR